ncbi:Cobalt transporter, subunit CbtB [Pseudorhizobium banfieldiae]|uniref:Cobalt transporter, subunit CbtB n=2 Tax=Pseudorhizobium banfieldiae TaxID=1125847 RepID=L0NJ46_9HYPH|nr:Cobalt transporter, subunit CbtB [Pseudorhizobium banfieldiae]
MQIDDPRVEGERTRSMTTKSASNVAVTSTSRTLSLSMSALLGLFVVGFVGFSHMDVVHNAAHDSRHSLAFPCH